jgi:hypothetical protein
VITTISPAEGWYWWPTRDTPSRAGDPCARSLPTMQVKQPACQDSSGVHLRN